MILTEVGMERSDMLPKGQVLAMCLNILPKISGLKPFYWSLSHHVEGYLLTRNLLLVQLHDPEIKFYSV